MISRTWTPVPPGWRVAEQVNDSKTFTGQSYAVLGWTEDGVPVINENGALHIWTDNHGEDPFLIMKDAVLVVRQS